MRILTWNINGLRAILKRKCSTLGALLDSLGADVICFQETKLTKADFDRQLAIVEGWDSYFSINRGRSAYSGTATFCRKSVTLPVDAQEGVTGILHNPQESLDENSLQNTGANEAAATIWASFSREELEIIDAEGRCVVTDHGAFVLFNVYGPAISKEENAAERFAYKLDFYRALSTRMEALRDLGRRVLLVGDLNISPQLIDCCEPGPNYLSRQDRVWLHSILKISGGPFLDAFRHHHPDRKEAYTCWQQASGARVNNWGTRIDHILAADGSSPPDNSSQDGLQVESLITDSDICPELTGSDHCPVWADFLVTSCLPTPGKPPPLSTSNLFTGKQNKLTDWLKAERKETPRPLGAISMKPALGLGATGGVKKEKAGPRNGPKARVQSNLKNFVKSTNSDVCTKNQILATTSRLQNDPDLDRAIAASLASLNESRAQDCASDIKQCNPCPDHREAPPTDVQRGPQSQHSLTVEQVSSANLRDDCKSRLRHNLLGREPLDPDQLIEEDARETALKEEAEQSGAAPIDFSQPRNAVPPEAAAAAWKHIQDRMKPPKCTGHNEDCVIRQVKKKGVNSGRLFYVCRRPDGAPPEGRCDFFKWSGNREVRGTLESKPNLKKR